MYFPVVVTTPSHFLKNSCARHCTRPRLSTCDFKSPSGLNCWAAAEVTGGLLWGPQQCGRLGQTDVAGTVLCLVGWLAASLASPTRCQLWEPETHLTLSLTPGKLWMSLTLAPSATSSHWTLLTHSVLDQGLSTPAAKLRSPAHVKCTGGPGARVLRAALTQSYWFHLTDVLSLF